MEPNRDIVSAFQAVTAGDQFLSLIQKVPDVWRQKPAHFHLWLARKRAGLTQAELARRAGVSQSFVARVERGRDARLSTMRRLYEAMGLRMLIVPLSTVLPPPPHQPQEPPQPPVPPTQ